MRHVSDVGERIKDSPDRVRIRISLRLNQTLRRPLIPPTLQRRHQWRELSADAVRHLRDVDWAVNLSLTGRNIDYGLAYILRNDLILLRKRATRIRNSKFACDESHRV